MIPALSSTPGPRALGRGVILRDGDDVPAAWGDAEAVRIDEAALDQPGSAITALHRAWVTRQPVVVVLAVDPGQFRAPVSITVEPWRLDAHFEVWQDRMHFLVWANNYDARDGKTPVWWWSRKAAQLGTQELTDGRPGDVLLPDGTAVWIDGGPRGPLDHAALGAPVIHAESVEAGHLHRAPDAIAVQSALAPDQLAAVAHGAGPARIVAPAGSGKTRVLTERLRHLIVDRRIEREGVLAVAYNKKAQLQLEERTADFRPRVSTLNAFGYRLLAEHAGGAPRVVEEREVRAIIQELVPKSSHRSNVDPFAPYIDGLSAIRLGLCNPREYERDRDDVPGLAKAFVPYRKELADRRAVDFDEQIYRAVELLLSDGAFRRRMQARCRHLLVDEFQDLTPAHMLMLRLLAAPGFNVFGVGDDDQVIYGHAGADPVFLTEYEQFFPGAATHLLEVNYRCPVKVVDAACALLAHNLVRVPKEIRPGPQANGDAEAIAVRQHDPETGAQTVVEIVQSWLAEGVPTSEIAVLTRVNSLLLAPSIALIEAGVPISSHLSPDILERTGVRAALAYLRLGASPHSLPPEDLFEVRNRPSRGLPPWISKWLQWPMSIGELRSTAKRIGDRRVGEKLTWLADDVEIVADAVSEKTTREVLRVIADTVGLGDALQILDSSKGGQRESQYDDLEALFQVADLHPDPRSFESWLRDVLQQRRTGTGVTLSSVHRVKGMEWDRVIVAGVVAGVLPHRLAGDIEEERRVLHVAITRCRQRAVVLADTSRPSFFLRELEGPAPAPRRPANDVRAESAGASKWPVDAGKTGRKTRRKTAKPAAATTIPLTDLPPEVARVEQALRQWRLQRQQADQVKAAYLVASNALLQAIAVARPQTLAELEQINGIGEKKLALYGADILAVVKAATA